MKFLHHWKKIGLLVAIILFFFTFSDRSQIVGWIGVIWRPETAVFYWKMSGKPFWQLLIIRIIPDFGELFFSWTLTGLVLKNTILKNNKDSKFVQGIIRKFEKKKNNPKTKRRIEWLNKKGNFILYLLTLIPIPGTTDLAAIVARMRQMKYGLLILGLINFIKCSLYVWLLWKGILFSSQ